MDQQLAGSVPSRLLEAEPVKPFQGISAAGVVFLSVNTGRVLLQFRASEKRHQFTWGFWGGIQEKNESVYQCLERELNEEIGFVPDIRRLNPIDVYQSADAQFRYYSFAAVVQDDFIPLLNPESCGYAWVDVGRWPKPLHEGAKSTLIRNRGAEKLITLRNQYA